MSEGAIWFWCILIGTSAAIAFLITLYLILCRPWKSQRDESPQCHVVGCNRLVMHSHYAYNAPYDVQYFCPRHTGELLDPDQSYVIEPWKTELSDNAIHQLIHTRRN